MFREYEFYKLAAQKMIDDNYLILDTETTGLGQDDEIIELGIIDCKGNVVYEGMFKPEKEIHPAAVRTSGITNEMLADKPLFADEFDKIIDAMGGRPVVIYNEEFDERMFYQTAQRYGLDTSKVDFAFSRPVCALKLYSQYIGFPQPKLEIACKIEGVNAVQDHRAVGDCLMTLALLERVADLSKAPDLSKYIVAKAERDGKTVDEVTENMYKSYSPPQSIKFGTIAFLPLLKQGKTIEEIAKLKNSKVSYVEEQVIKLYIDNEFDNLDMIIQPQYEDEILKIMHSGNWNGRYTPIKEQMPDDCTWNCIKAVVAKDNKENIFEKRFGSISLNEQIATAEENKLNASDVAGKEKFLGTLNNVL